MGSPDAQELPRGTQTAIPARRWRKRAHSFGPWLALAALAGAFSLQRIRSFDYWWHLASGAFIVRTGAVPRTDPFSYTAAGDRWVDVQWHSGKHKAEHTVSLDLTIANDAGVLGRICTLIGEQKANISNLQFVDRKPDYYRLIIDVDLRDVEHLHAVMLMLEADSDVAGIRRHRDLARAP